MTVATRKGGGDLLFKSTSAQTRHLIHGVQNHGYSLFTAPDGHGNTLQNKCIDGNLQPIPFLLFLLLQFPFSPSIPNTYVDISEKNSMILTHVRNALPNPAQSTVAALRRAGIDFL